MFHLGWFVNGYKAYDWDGTWPGPVSSTWSDPSLFVDLARALERAAFDYVMLEDSSFVPDTYGGTMEVYLRNGMMVPKSDPAVLAAVLSQATTRLGIVSTLSTAEYPPYLLARQVATLDQVSAGRAGWNIVTGFSDRAAQNYGHDEIPEHDRRYERADEFVDLVTQLWSSWEDDAVVADRDTGTLIAPDKVQVVDFEGRFFRSRGPLNTSRPPQGRPTLVQAGGSPRGRALAAKWADSVIGYVRTPEQMRGYRDDIRARAAAFGRDPDEVKVLFLLTPFLGETEDEARGRSRRNFERVRAQPEPTLSMQSFLLGIDFSSYDLDTPLRDLADELASNGHQSILDAMIAAAGDRTLREVALERRHLEVVGTPDQAADQMAAMMEEVGGDGFLITLPLAELNRRLISEVTDGLVPALQRRGLVRSEYLSGTLRDNLLAF